MVAKRRTDWSGWTARLVALLFAVQAGLLAFSQGVSADTLRRDQFGNVLCLASTETGHGGTHRTSDSHDDMMACCSIGCSMFAGVASSPPTPEELADTFVASPPRRFVSYAHLLSTVPKSPRSTRGPPVAA